MQSTEGQSVIPYNEENQQKALAEIAEFDANHGGTDIYTPLTQAKELKSRLAGDDEDDTIEKRVFVLTDGQCGQNHQIFNFCRANSTDMQVYSFGLGSGCDESLCRGMAESGQGTCSIVPDESPNLTEIVIKAL